MKIHLPVSLHPCYILSYNVIVPRVDEKNINKHKFLKIALDLIRVLSLSNVGPNELNSGIWPSINACIANGGWVLRDVGAGTANPNLGR